MGKRYLHAFLLFACIGLTACTSSSKLVDHSFSFDAILDSPGITILDYRYGSSDFPGTANTEERRKDGRSDQGTGTTGPMVPGEELYVKWRIDATNQIVERTVDLRNKFPKNLDGHTVYFIVEGAQLFVYLVTPEARDTRTPPIGSKKHRHRKVVRLVPDSQSN